MNCKCGEFPSVFDAAETDVAAIDQMDRIDKESPPEHNGYYMSNKQCGCCGQIWRVPRRKSSKKDRLYFKVPKNADHHEYDETELRIEFVRSNYGESAIRKCSWSNCEDKALQTMVFCAYHAYHGPGVIK